MYDLGDYKRLKIGLQVMLRDYSHRPIKERNLEYEAHIANSILLAALRIAQIEEKVLQNLSES